jgi:hypothetical protein
MTTEFAAPRVIRPGAEEACRREACGREPACRSEFAHEDCGPAYRVGYTGPVRRLGEFDALEGEWKDDFDRVRRPSRLRWGEAREVTLAAWRRVTGREDHPY